ncbi:MAG: FadR/GntR family transcriptional regulator [Candidatus Acidiferrales bacterium]
MRVRQMPSGFPRKDGSRNLTHALVDALSESIYSCAIRPGDKLPSEAKIMTEYGVSRTVVREAITSLQAAGLIETRHGIGSFVRAVPSHFEFQVDTAAILTVRDVLDMLDLRISLETEAAAFAAARRTEKQIEEMRRALDSFKANVDSVEKTVAPDFQFHLQIAYATGNRYFADIMTHLGTNTIPRTRVNEHQSSESRVQYLSMVNREHENIFEGILRRDPEGARTAMRTHLVGSRERLRRAHDLAIDGTNSQGRLPHKLQPISTP